MASWGRNIALKFVDHRWRDPAKCSVSRNVLCTWVYFLKDCRFSSYLWRKSENHSPPPFARNCRQSIYAINIRPSGVPKLRGYQRVEAAAALRTKRSHRRGQRQSQRLLPRLRAPHRLWRRRRIKIHPRLKLGMHVTDVGAMYVPCIGRGRMPFKPTSTHPPAPISGW